MGVSKDTGPSDLLMTILVRKVRVDTASDWIIKCWWTRKGFSRPQEKVANGRY